MTRTGGRDHSPVVENSVAAWLAELLPNATGWEILAALIGVAAVGFAGWGAIDNGFDMRAIKRDERVRRVPSITANFLLLANLLALAGWLGYTHVAVMAAYLPPRDDVSGVSLSQIAVMRLAYGIFGLLGQVTLRVMRARLRSLTPEEWEPYFGEAAAWKAKYHHAQSEVLRQRAEKHETLNRETAWQTRAQLLGRLLRQHNIDVPPALQTKEES